MKSLLDKLLDPDDREPIVLMDETMRRIAFEQIAIIPYGDDEESVIYAILKPIDCVEGIEDDEEVVIFRVDFDHNDEALLRVETDEEIAEKIFAKFTALIDAERERQSKAQSDEPDTETKKKTEE